MRLVAESFAWPFRGAWRSSWAPGLLAVLLLPIAFVPLLGYAIAATRAAASDPAHGPPKWTISARLLADGFWTAMALALLSVPFALVLNPLAEFLFEAHLWRVGDRSQSEFYAHLASGFILALPWGLALLLLMPHATARFATTARPGDLFDFGAAIQGVRRGFAAWNLAAAAMVTAWAAGVACVGLLCIGLVPGIFYAILVSAHASAALHDQDPDSPPR
ncbi:DUF4013 domain-containing protein [bacterium]|nr:MAG: DUF4013 domain-containing protein [bacterium]